MRKVRDYDAELKALGDKARALKAKRVEQLGHAETLAGVLLDAVGSKDASAKEAWRSKGAAFFQRRGKKGSGGAGGERSGAQVEPGGDAARGSNAASNG